jgi:hypothetical protein
MLATAWPAAAVTAIVGVTAIVVGMDGAPARCCGCMVVVVTSGRVWV